MLRRLIIDDVRVFLEKEGYETVTRLTAYEGLDSLYEEGPWDEVWLDHDLGWDNVTGTYVVDYILQMKRKGITPGVRQWYVHSANMLRGDIMYDNLKRHGFPVIRCSSEQLEMLDWKATDYRMAQMHDFVMARYNSVYGRSESDAASVAAR